MIPSPKPAQLLTQLINAAAGAEGYFAPEVYQRAAQEAVLELLFYRDLDQLHEWELALAECGSHAALEGVRELVEVAGEVGAQDRPGWNGFQHPTSTIRPTPTGDRRNALRRVARLLYRSNLDGLRELELAFSTKPDDYPYLAEPLEVARVVVGEDRLDPWQKQALPEALPVLDVLASAGGKLLTSSEIQIRLFSASAQRSPEPWDTFLQQLTRLDLIRRGPPGGGYRLTGAGVRAGQNGRITGRIRERAGDSKSVSVVRVLGAAPVMWQTAQPAGVAVGFAAEPVVVRLYASFARDDLKQFTDEFRAWIHKKGNTETVSMLDLSHLVSSMPTIDITHEIKELGQNGASIVLIYEHADRFEKTQIDNILDGDIVTISDNNHHEARWQYIDYIKSTIGAEEVCLRRPTPPTKNSHYIYDKILQERCNKNQTFFESRVISRGTKTTSSIDMSASGTHSIFPENS